MRKFRYLSYMSIAVALNAPFIALILVDTCIVISVTYIDYLAAFVLSR